MKKSKHHRLLIKDDLSRTIFAKNFSSLRSAYKFAVSHYENPHFSIHNIFAEEIDNARLSNKKLIERFGNLNKKNNKFKFKTRNNYFDCIVSYSE